MTPSIIPNNTYLAKVAVKSTPGLADVEVLPLAVPGQVGLHPDGRGCPKKVVNDS